MQHKHKHTLVAILNVVTQNLFGHTSRAWCNANLCTHKILWEEFMTEDDGTPSTHNLKLLKDFPSDLHSAHHALHIEPDTTEYAACSKCNTIYPPKTIGRRWSGQCTVTIHMTHGLFSFLSHTYSTPFPHLLHSDSYLSRL